MATPRGESTDAGHRDGLPRSSNEAPVMGGERRGQVIPSGSGGQPESGRSHRNLTKPFTIPKGLVYQAYKRVRANKGCAGVDDQSLQDFEIDLSNNLYKLWNRLSSGSYHPPPVMRVDIEKADGGTRRWLSAPVQFADGSVEERDRGAPQGGVISPLLANLFLHYVFDRWVEKRWGGIQFERYADDIVCHCASEREAQALKSVLEARFTACGLTLHPRKTKIVYCKGGHNQQDYPVIAFDFLSYTFRPRLSRNRQGQKRVYFTAAISQSAAKEIRKQINEWSWKWWRQKELGQFARFCQSRLRGWMQYYGLFGRSYIRNVLFHFDLRLSRWAVGKYRKLRGLLQAARRVNGLRRRQPTLFAHWVGSRAMVG